MTCKICKAVRNVWEAVRPRSITRKPVTAPYIAPDIHLLFPGEKIITVGRKSDEI